jgi:alanine racemase
MIPAAYAVINPDAVRHNLSQVRRCAPNAKVMAVIKANGYGHGMLRMAEALQQADAFAVARVDEGVRLRKAGFKNRIAVLEGFTCAAEFKKILHYQVDAVVHSITQLDIIETYPQKTGCAIWLKVDTGMNRLGFKPAEFNSAYQRLSSCPQVQQPINLMTHFANADDVNDPKTVEQTALFYETVDGYPGGRSLANSAGILAWGQSLSDWVRPGIMLYGISPFPEATGQQLGLKPVMTLQSQLIAVKPIEVGDTVGYGSSWVCHEPTSLAVVAIGYGDGYPRHAKAGTPVLVNGLRVPIVGRVSMDMLTVDLGAHSSAKPGDPVILWGEGLPVEEIAQWADTIPYTLVCGVTRRVRMVMLAAL